MSEELDKKVDRMPKPEFIQVSPNSRIAFTYNEKMPIALTISWQWVLAKIGEALIARNSKEIFQLLFSDVNYIQLNNNAVEDIRSIVKKPVDENALREIQVKIASFKELMSEYLSLPQNNQSRLNYIINESHFLVQKLKILEVVGLGAFMLASGFRLALLQEKAKSDVIEWSNVKNRAIEYSHYAINMSTKLYRLTVGLIDKECKCIKWRVGAEGEERTTEHECRYSDGKNIHIFRDINSNVINECNKHRLQMFYDVTDKVNQAAANPVRETIKKWHKLAASI